MTISEFEDELKKLGIEITEFQKKQLEKYYELLIEYNKVMNLTGIVEKNQVYLKHFYDSITLIRVANLNQVSNLCDIGTGAGFPGLVLKIIFPNIKVVLLDSLQKRIQFLNCVIETLNLQKIEAIHVRAEEYAIKHRNEFDITTARAVAHLSILLEYAIPLTKEKGYFIALKGNVFSELNEVTKALEILSTKIEKIDIFQLPIEQSNRTIIKFKKEKDNKKYPRKYSDIKKKRL